MLDYVGRYWETMRERDPLHNVRPGFMRELLPSTAPEQAEHWDDIFADLDEIVVDGVRVYIDREVCMCSCAQNTHWFHPRFFAYFPAGLSYASVIGDILSSGLGSVGFSWVSRVNA